MGSCASSCCHRQARLTVGDKVINVVLGCFLPLARVGRQGVAFDKNVKLLEACRKSESKITRSAYEKDVKQGRWAVEAKVVERSAESGGGSFEILIHRPTGGQGEAGGKRMPLVVWNHGGGLTISSAKDSFGARLFNEIAAAAAGTPCPFCWASVDYRLAPEARLSGAVEDVEAAVCALRDPALAEALGYDPRRLVLAGVSAGALVAGHAAARLAQKGEALPSLALLYPMVDPEMAMVSWTAFGDLPSCPRAWIRWSWDAAIAGNGQAPSEAQKREASLLHANWAAARGMPVLIMLGAFDPLHDEGKALGDQLDTSGLRVDQVLGLGSHSVAHMFDTQAKAKLLSWFHRTLAA